jgi:hypothetical protein
VLGFLPLSTGFPLTNNECALEVLIVLIPGFYCRRGIPTIPLLDPPL